MHTLSILLPLLSSFGLMLLSVSSLALRHRHLSFVVLLSAALVLWLMSGPVLIIMAGVLAGYGVYNYFRLHLLRFIYMRSPAAVSILLGWMALLLASVYMLFTHLPAGNELPPIFRLAIFMGMASFTNLSFLSDKQEHAIWQSRVRDSFGRSYQGDR